MKALAVVLCFCLMLLLAACGGGDDDDLNADGDPLGGDGIGVVVNDDADESIVSPGDMVDDEDTMGPPAESGEDIFGSDAEGTGSGTIDGEDGELFAPESGQGVDGG